MLEHYLRALVVVFVALAPVCAEAAANAAAEPEAPQIDAAFPGGNIVLDRIEGDRVLLHQDLRDTAGFWFYYCFRVRGAAGRTLTFQFTQGNPLAARGPAVSTDGGRSWQWLGAVAVRGESFTYAFGPWADEVRFCLAFPYLESNLQQFLKKHAESKHLKVETLCTTKKGRKTELLRLGKLAGEPDHRALITCRHHCCEMMASWALEGLMETVLADEPEGRWLREHVEFAVVPFMDKDGVEDGDQGKNRKPHDHNRDYLGESIYPSTAALRKLVPEWSQGKLRIACDLHCPSVRGGGDNPGSNEQIFIVGKAQPDSWERQQQFGRLLEQVQRGPLVYRAKHNLPWGVGWNNAKEPRSFGGWAGTLPEDPLVLSLEIPYATAGSKEVTDAAARAFGADLARAMRARLEQRE